MVFRYWDCELNFSAISDVYDAGLFAHRIDDLLR